MGKKMMIGVLLILILIVGVVLVNFYFENFVSKETELTPEFLEWINQSKQLYDSDNPYVICLFERTCEGIFSLEIEINPEENITLIENMLSEYGEVTYTRENSIHLETKSLYGINNFFGNSSIANITIYSINPDKINIPDEELYSCDSDDDCVAVSSGCGCTAGGKNIAINKKHLDNFNLYHNLADRMIACAAVMSNHWTCFSSPKCVNNTCQFVYNQNWVCESDLIFICEEYISEDKWDESKIWVGDKSLLCSEIFDLCNISYEDETEENSTLVITINEPIEGMIIFDDEVYIKATTNGTAICQYSWTARFPDSTGSISIKQMNITNGISHSQLLEDLKEGYYTLKLSCTGESGDYPGSYVEFKMDPLFSDLYNLTYHKKFIGTSVGLGLLTKNKLPNLLKDQDFYSGDNIDVTAIQTLDGYGKMIENSTSNGDLETPKVLIEIGTDYNNYLYEYRLIFSKAVNFSSMYLGDYIEMLGESYKVQEGSSNQKIIFRKWDSEDDIIFEDNQPVKINSEIIGGTMVNLNNDWGDITDINIKMAMHDSSKDYIAVWEYYDEVIFDSLRLNFKSYSEEEGAEIYLESC